MGMLSMSLFKGRAGYSLFDKLQYRENIFMSVSIGISSLRKKDKIEALNPSSGSKQLLVKMIQDKQGLLCVSQKTVAQ